MYECTEPRATQEEIMRRRTEESQRQAERGQFHPPSPSNATPEQTVPPQSPLQRTNDIPAANLTVEEWEVFGQEDGSVSLLKAIEVGLRDIEAAEYKRKAEDQGGKEEKRGKRGTEGREEDVDMRVGSGVEGEQSEIHITPEMARVFEAWVAKEKERQKKKKLSKDEAEARKQLVLNPIKVMGDESLLNWLRS